jgi:Zn finger protein HypA/HybF involved in hydrogenase expression
MELEFELTCKECGDKFDSTHEGFDKCPKCEEKERMGK